METKQLDCGCVISRNDGTLSIKYCPHHGASTELYGALRELYDLLEKKGYDRVLQNAEGALAKYNALN